MEVQMLDDQLFGFWCDGGDPGNGSAPGGDNLIFFPDGTGRYEFINWILCSADEFRWETPHPGVLRLVGQREFQINPDKRCVDVQPSRFGVKELKYRIEVESTRFGTSLRVLRLPLEIPFANCFGFRQTNLIGLEAPDFSYDLEQWRNEKA